MADERTLRILRMMEGLSEASYVDASGRSIGYGHFIKKGEEHLLGARLTKEQSEALLLKDVESHSSAGLQNLKVPIGKNERTALDLLAYNAGPGAAQSVVRLLNQGKRQEAVDKFSEYIKSRKTEGGPLTVNPELVKRREYERRLFLTKDSGTFDETFGTRTTTRATVGAKLGPAPTHATESQAGTNAQVLADLRILSQELGMDGLQSEALNRIRIEGGGRA